MGVYFPKILNTIANNDLGCTADRASCTCPILHFARRWQSTVPLDDYKQLW